jgi:hypothetical protein
MFYNFLLVVIPGILKISRTAPKEYDERLPLLRGF